MRTPAVLLLSLSVLGCARQPAWQKVEPDQLAPAQAAQAAKGEIAWKALGASLLAELSKAIATRQASGAIDVCRTLAPRLCAEIGTEYGVTIGRTAVKLRNPGNQIPDWAKQHIAAGDGNPATLRHEDGRLGLLQAIRLMPLCVQCHGQPAELGAGVAAAIAQHYPNDQATGFRVGDLRGWFWVEVPAAR